MTVNSRHGLVVDGYHRAFKKDKIILKSGSTIEFAGKKFAWCSPDEVAFNIGDLFVVNDNNGKESGKTEKLIDVDSSNDYPYRPSVCVSYLLVKFDIRR